MSSIVAEYRQPWGYDYYRVICLMDAFQNEDWYLYHLDDYVCRLYPSQVKLTVQQYGMEKKFDHHRRSVI